MSCKNQNFDYIIKKNDTLPSILYKISNCENIDLNQNNLIIKANMWANSSLANAISSTETNIKLKNNYNISAASVEDYILIKKHNYFEYLKVESISDDDIYVSRGQLSSTPRNWGKYTQIKIIKIVDVECEKEITYNEAINLNGEKENIVSQQNLIYNWFAGDTSNPGEYFLEFEVTKNNGGITEWTKKFPSEKEGIKIQIIDNNLEI